MRCWDVRRRLLLIRGYLYERGEKERVFAIEECVDLGKSCSLGERVVLGRVLNLFFFGWKKGERAAMMEIKEEGESCVSSRIGIRPLLGLEGLEEEEGMRDVK